MNAARKNSLTTLSLSDETVYAGNIFILQWTLITSVSLRYY